MTSRAGIVVTGTEVLTGRVSDRNGPWLAEQLRIVGVDIAQIIVVGDRRQDLLESLRFLASTGVDIIITSGGLGPTADDLTAEVVGQFQQRPSALDTQLEKQIAAIVADLSAGRGWQTDPASTAAATAKQARVPVGAAVLAPVGTAPGLVVPAPKGSNGPPVVVLPGPPRELQGMWPAVLRDPWVAKALAGNEPLLQSTIRLWATPESELAATLREHDALLTGLEITTCLHGGELEIVTRYGPQRQSAYDDFSSMISSAHADAVFSTDGSTIDDIVAESLLRQGLTIATAESCTAGLLAGRLADRPGSSAYLLGGLVVYANTAKHELAGVPSQLIDSVGAVSPEVATALAAGARARVGADIGVGITGVAGPGGGSETKPVGLVCLSAGREGKSIDRRVQIPGSRADVRSRAVLIAMHMVRALLAE